MTTGQKTKDKSLRRKLDDIVRVEKGDTRISDKDTRKLLHKGNVAYRVGNFSLASQHFFKAWKSDQDNLYLLTVISHSLGKLGKREVALELIEKAIEVHGLTEDLCIIISDLALDMGMHDVAEEIYNHAIQLNPTVEEHYIGLASAIEKQNRPDEAIALMREVVKPFSKSSNAWCHLATLIKNHQGPNEAYELYGKSLELNPKNIMALNNYARIQPPKKARKLARQALKVNPKAAEPHMLLAFSLLLEGRLKEAWQHYEFRNDPSRGAEQACQYTHDFPGWNGSSLKGKKVLLTAEQGIGDEVYFAAGIHELLNRGAILFLGCDKRLVDIYERSFKGVRAFSYTDLVENDIRYRSFPELESLCKKGKVRIDYAMPVGSIPKYFWHTRADVPTHKDGYLKADPVLVEKYKRMLDDISVDKLRIGISWRSGIINAERAAGALGVDNVIKIMSTNDAEFICLQYSYSQDEIDTIQEATGKTLHTWPDVDLKKDIEANLAIMANIDMAVGSNSATLLLSMAAGARTLVISLGSPWWKYDKCPLSLQIPHASNSEILMAYEGRSISQVTEIVNKKIQANEVKADRDS